MIRAAMSVGCAERRYQSTNLRAWQSQFAGVAGDKVAGESTGTASDGTVSTGCVTEGDVSTGNASTGTVSMVVGINSRGGT
jgi:hypothetical protein